MTHVFGSERSPEALLRAVHHEVVQHGGGLRRPEAPRSHVWTVALSFEAGAGESALAREIGQRLGWPVYDHELLEQMAREMNVQVSSLEGVDERHTSWLRESLESFAAVSHVSENTYVRRLVQTLLTLAAKGNCVIVGRGSALVLPPASTLRIRVVGVLDDRVLRVSRERGLSAPDATRYVEELDRERARFAREHFQRDVRQVDHFHLVVNTSRLPIADCADLVVETLRRLQALESYSPTAAREEYASV